MFTGPVGPVEVFFYWPEVVFGNFYWPGAIGSPLASSPVAHYGACRGLPLITFSIATIAGVCTIADGTKECHPYSDLF